METVRNNKLRHGNVENNCMETETKTIQTPHEPPLKLKWVGLRLIINCEELDGLRLSGILRLVVILFRLHASSCGFIRLHTASYPYCLEHSTRRQR